ncbi:tripartite motif-containing protein 66-like [Mercenaria mercenaria]|uniref:tripartite motif-containing protein 66-like n=1 Tax=Mercenaria mercenaria TaxID=6596 RepID=UPI00234F3824|nr:tripartite motif-containing protein 66-like [Mercenaria mercenaria]
MATGGKSQTDASDVIHDFPCFPCSEEDKNTEAFYECVDCHTHYCQRCMDGHNRFVKNHTILDKHAMKSGRSQRRQSPHANLPEYTCDEHHGEVIKMFCGYHDIVCCTVCIAVKHRSCEGVEYIPNIARSKVTSTSIQTGKNSLEKVKTYLQDINSERILLLQEMNKKEDNTIKDIEKFKKSLVDRVEELERSSVSEVKAMYKKIKEDIACDIENINQMLEGISHRHNITLKNTGNDDDVKLFVTSKLMEMEAKKGKDCVNAIVRKGKEVVHYEINTSIKTDLKDVKFLAKLRVYNAALSVNILDLCGTSALSSFTESLQADLTVNGITSQRIKATELDEKLYTVVVCDLETCQDSLRQIRNKK